MSVVGNVQHLGRISSKHLALSRDVWVWLPPGWRPGVSYPVLALHDGRQVFDPATSTWGVDWGVDDTGQDMVSRGLVRPFIAVAADCTADREREYSPDGVGADYLRFWEEELLPPVAREFGGTGPKCMAGASMGGLISFCAGWWNPSLWSGLACLSPAFCGPWLGWALSEIAKAKASQTLPSTRFLVACGGAPGLEENLLAGTREVVAALRGAGFGDDALEVRIDPAAEHNEAAWAKLVPWILARFFGDAR